MKRVLFIIAFVYTSVGFSQQIQWISFEELEDKIRTEPRKVMVFIYADWCKFCELQESTTFNDSMIINKLNADYYCVKLNFDETSDIQFLQRTYHYIPSGLGTGRHQLVEYLGSNNGELKIPTTVFMNSKLQLNQRIQNMIDKITMKNILEKE